MKRNILRTFVVFLILVLLSGYLFPVTVNADYWEYNKNLQIYKRWQKQINGNDEFYICYRIEEPIIEYGEFLNPKGASSAENKFLRYYYKKGDKIGLSIQNEVTLSIDWDIDANYDANLCIKLGKNDEYIKWKVGKYYGSKDKLGCQIDTDSYQDASTDYFFNFYDWVPEDVIDARGFTVSVLWYCEGQKYTAKIIEFIPRCYDIQKGLLADGFKLVGQQKTLSLDKNSDIYQYIIGNDYTIEEILDESFGAVGALYDIEWKEEQDGMIQTKTVNVKRKNTNDKSEDVR